MRAQHLQRSIVRERRRFLGLLGAVGATLLALPWLPHSGQGGRLSLREADFYRPGGGPDRV